MLSWTQKKIVVAGIGCLALLVFVVPWQRNYEGHRVGPKGYAFIFAPPGGATEIDVPRMLIPMGLVVVATAAGVFLTARPKLPEKRA